MAVTEDGRGLGESGWPDGGGLGGSNVRNMVAHVDGKIDIASGKAGTGIRVAFPVD